MVLYLIELRNKMRDLTSKSYSLNIDKEIIKSEQKSDPTSRDLYNLSQIQAHPFTETCV